MIFFFVQEEEAGAERLKSELEALEEELDVMTRACMEVEEDVKVLATCVYIRYKICTYMYLYVTYIHILYLACVEVEEDGKVLATCVYVMYYIIYIYIYIYI